MTAHKDQGHPHKSEPHKSEPPKAHAPQHASAHKPAETKPHQVSHAQAPQAKAQAAAASVAQAVPKAANTSVKAAAETVREGAQQTQKAASEAASKASSMSSMMMGFGFNQAGTAWDVARRANEAFTASARESAETTMRGWTEINAKLMDLVRLQAEANLTIWRSLARTGSMADAVEIQTREARKAYEATTAQVKDIAETATRVASQAIRPMQKVWGETLPQQIKKAS